MSVCFGLLEMKGTILLANPDEFVFVLWKELDFRNDSLWQQQILCSVMLQYAVVNNNTFGDAVMSFTLKDKHLSLHSGVVLLEES